MFTRRYARALIWNEIFMLNLSLLEKIIDKAIKEKVFPGAVVELNTGITLPRLLFPEIIFYLENPLYNKRFDVGQGNAF